MKKIGRQVGEYVDDEHLDFSSLSESEKVKAYDVVLNVEIINSQQNKLMEKIKSFITVIKTGEKFYFIDYIKNY
jgi:hypothetical protein